MSAFFEGKMRLEVAKKEREHANLVYSWRSDPEAKAASLHQAPESFEEYFIRYGRNYFLLKDLPSVFALVEGIPVAFTGFSPLDIPLHPERKSAAISIVVAKEHRKKGIGLRFLQEIKAFALQQGYDDLYAEIRPANTVSLRVFEKAGYEFVREITKVIDDGGVQKNVLVKLFCQRITPFKEDLGVCVVAEAGSNWRMGSYSRDLKMAKTLIAAAKEAGCDVVKFQTFRPESIYVPNAGTAVYLEAFGIQEDMKTLFEDLAMPYEMIPELANMCKEVNIEFMSTPFSPQDFRAVDPYVSRHKIGSYEISHIRLLECVAKSNKPIFLSTGASQLADIEWAVNYLKQCGNSDITLLQCSAQYPASPSGMNLRACTTLKNYFQLPVGLSDHTLDPYAAPCAAVALGAKVIEKHFTIDKRLPGPDHAFALEPHELKAMVAAIRMTHEMLGSGIKEVQHEEKELYLYARRRVQAIMEIAPGEVLEEGKNIAILRPGRQKPGCHPRHIDQIIGRRATRKISLGEGIQYGDWK